MPTTQPPGLFVSALVSIAVLPIVGFLVVISIPVHFLLVLWHVASSPFTRRKLQRLEQRNWNLPQQPLLEASDPILVVGSGIGGLTVAHFLIRCGYTNVKVFEKYGDCGLDRGGGHGLISGSWCYSSMGLPEVFTATIDPATHWRFDSGRQWLSWSLPLAWIHSNPFLPALHYPLGNFVRSDFLKYLSEALPEGVLHYHHELVDIVQEDQELVRAVFANGKEYTGRLLVGCDGSKSPTRSLMRQQLANTNASTTNERAMTKLSPSEDPFYVDINVWWCVTKLSDIPLLERSTWDHGPSRLYFEGGAIMHLMAHSNLILVVDYRAPSLRRHHKQWTANATGADLLDFMKDWKIPERYWPVAKHASRVAQFAIPKGFEKDAQFWHNSQNVVLLGDAVHPTPHFFGQGANAAIQDAYCLVRCLRHHDGHTLATAFSEYVSIRKPPADDIVSKSYLLGLTETAGGIQRLVRDLIFFTVLKTGLFVWAAVDINTVRV